MNKVCKTCNVEKPSSEFYKDVTKKDLLSGSCKVCKLAWQKQYRQEHLEARRAYDNARYLTRKEEASEYKKEYYRKNKEKVKTTVKKWAQANRDRINANMRAWYQDNKECYYIKDAQRCRRKKEALVSWEKELTAFVLSELVHLRQIREEVTHIKWEIDHIIPLQSKEVCGLHVWNNFRLITRSENRKKHNKLLEDL